MQLDEHEGVFLPRGAVIRRTLQHRGEQHLGIEVDLVCDADAGQQAHRLDVVTVPQQVRPDERLGRLQIAVHEQPHRNDHLLR